MPKCIFLSEIICMYKKNYIDTIVSLKKMAQSDPLYTNFTVIIDVKL